MKYIPFIYMDIKSNRKLILVAEAIIWPILGLAGLGFFSRFTEASFGVKLFLFTGSMIWTAIYLAHHTLGRGFMACVWYRTFKQVFSSPLKLKDLVIGHSIYGMISSAVGFFIVASFALLFHFNIFSIGVYLPVAVFLSILTGLSIGMMTISFIILFGMRVDFLVWIIIDVLVFVSGLYYSVSVFPQPVQSISKFFPIVYILEGIRGALVGNASWLVFIKGFIVAAVWLVVTWFLTKRVDTYARRTGFYEKYG